MRELALHILDIVQNSIRARATEVRIDIDISTSEDLLVIEIGDNGEGMCEEMIQAVLDPFVTTRTTRRVGLGLPLFKAAAERSDGDLTLKSRKDIGTTVKATFKLSHIDRTPMGDLISTMITLIQGSPEIDFLLNYTFDNKNYHFSTKYIRSELGGVPLNHPMLLDLITGDLQNGLKDILIE